MFCLYVYFVSLKCVERGIGSEEKVEDHLPAPSYSFACLCYIQRQNAKCHLKWEQIEENENSVPDVKNV